MKWTDNIKGLQHIGIPTKDIQKTVEFYEKIGFQPILKTDNGGVPVVFLKSGELILETYQCDTTAMRDGSIDHFAINVTNIEEVFSGIKALGIKILEPITFLPFWEKGVNFFIAEGPNMERIEFAQYL